MNTSGKILCIATVFVIHSCAEVTGDPKENPVEVAYHQPAGQPQLPVDSSLVDQKVRIWRESDKKIKLRNCRHWIAGQDSVWVKSEFESASAELCKCIDDAIYGMPTMDDDAIQRVAESCMDSSY
jgi:hypothetical protein